MRGKGVCVYIYCLYVHAHTYIYVYIYFYSKEGTMHIHYAQPTSHGEEYEGYRVSEGKSQSENDVVEMEMRKRSFFLHSAIFVLFFLPFLLFDAS